MRKNAESLNLEDMDNFEQLKNELVNIKGIFVEDVLVPKSKELKHSIMESKVLNKTGEKIIEFKGSKLYSQIDGVVQTVNENSLVKSIKLNLNKLFLELRKKYNFQLVKGKFAVVKKQFDYGKSKVKEMNENLNKKTSVIIGKKMLSHFAKDEFYLDHAMAKVLLNKRLKNHPMRIELVYAIEQSTGYYSTEEALKLLQNDYVISHPQIVEIIELVSKTNYPQCLALCSIVTVFSQSKEENMLEIMKVISETEDYGCVKNAITVAFNNDFDSDTKFKLITEIVKGDIYTSTLITTLATDYREQLNGDLLETAKLVNLYKCHSKLESATEQMLGEDGLLSDESLRQESIETLKHFVDYEDDETEMFSCIELFSEETDPTYEREFDIIQNELLNMPPKQRTKVFKLIRRLSPVIQSQVEKSK